MSGSPREYACPSDAEEHAALYNMARCCCCCQHMLLLLLLLLLTFAVPAGAYRMSGSPREYACPSDA
jgi:hypothetical protein